MQEAMIPRQSLSFCQFMYPISLTQTKSSVLVSAGLCHGRSWGNAGYVLSVFIHCIYLLSCSLPSLALSNRIHLRPERTVEGFSKVRTIHCWDHDSVICFWVIISNKSFTCWLFRIKSCLAI